MCVYTEFDNSIDRLVCNYVLEKRSEEHKASVLPPIKCRAIDSHLLILLNKRTNVMKNIDECRA